MDIAKRIKVEQSRRFLLSRSSGRVRVGRAFLLLTDPLVVVGDFGENAGAYGLLTGCAKAGQPHQIPGVI